jgi:tetratricopeptide (TPR) repeat protein
MDKRPFVIIAAAYTALMAIVLAIDLSDPGASGDPIVLLVIYTVWLAVLMLVQYLHMRRLMKWLALLNDQCDPSSFLWQTERKLDRAVRWGQKTNICTHRLNMAAGLSAAGRYDEALATLPDFNQLRNGRRGRMMQATYHHNAFCIFMGLGRLDEARQALDALRAALGDSAPLMQPPSGIPGVSPAKTTQYLRWLCKLDSVRYGMARGDFDGAEAVFQYALNKARDNHQRVSAALQLGRVYAHFGRMDEARQAFEYVIEQGYRLHAVAQARAELAALAA